MKDKVILSDHLNPVMKHVYPDGSGLFQDDDTSIHRARGLTTIIKTANEGISFESTELRVKFQRLTGSVSSNKALHAVSFNLSPVYIHGSSDPHKFDDEWLECSRPNQKSAAACINFEWAQSLFRCEYLKNSVKPL